MFEQQLILVVDDTLTNLAFISEALTNAGFKVVTALDGKKALKQVQSLIPDLILLDITMPGIDGFETCKQLKANPETRHVPVIFMTGVSDPESKIKGFNLGAVDYIIKPFHDLELLARVKVHLQLRNLNKELEKRVLERTAVLTATLLQLQQSQCNLIQSEKMSALGSLMAGVAHEINNPIGFISGNLQPAYDYVEDLLTLIDLYQKTYPNPTAEIQEKIESIDLEYLREDLSKLLFSMKEGVQRIKNISNSLRIFSRADSERKVPFNIHEGIDSTLLILKHRLKANDKRPAITVIKDYGEFSPLVCFPGQLNQVFMNIISNAIDALDEASIGRCFSELENHPNQITIKTLIVSDENITMRDKDPLTVDRVVICIKDNGLGMSEEVKSRIFDHLFTTKSVGKGTGLGLSISRQIVEKAHQGKLSCISSPKEGSELIVEIPINQS